MNKRELDCLDGTIAIEIIETIQRNDYTETNVPELLLQKSLIIARREVEQIGGNSQACLDWLKFLILSPRQIQIALLKYNGLTHEEVTTKLSTIEGKAISFETVKSHLSSGIFTKMDVNSMHELTEFMRNLGIQNKNREFQTSKQGEIEITNPMLSQVAELICQGRTNDEIATIIGKSPTTAKTYIADIFDQYPGFYNGGKTKSRSNIVLLFKRKSTPD